MNPIEKLNKIGQSIWMDNIERKLLENGETKALIDRGDIRGMTSNPTIFDKAIEKTHDYDEALVPLAWAGWDKEKIFWELIVEDIRTACDLFLPLYEESNGGDGYVSIEVSPDVAHDTEATLAQVEQLWARVRRPNLMVKIPATKEGIPAIRRSIAAGVNPLGRSPNLFSRSARRAGSKNASTRPTSPFQSGASAGLLTDGQ